MTTTERALGIRSMTGQGRAQKSGELGTVSVEIRTVNHRGIKCSVRTGDALSGLASRIDALVRSRLHRGSINVQAAFKPCSSTTANRIDQDMLLAYHDQLRIAQKSAGVNESIDWVSLVQLPGVLVGQDSSGVDEEELWSFVHPTVIEALDHLDAMRVEEGAAMSESILADLKIIQEKRVEIEARTPQVTDRYRARLEAKIRQLLEQHELAVDQIDLLREIQVYADRVDVSEEITRLSSHLQLVSNVLLGSPDEEKPSTDAKEASTQDPVGRKLDFIVQEMFREANTIGSKASDAKISAQVVDIKCALERMRELIQNLE